MQIPNGKKTNFINAFIITFLLNNRYIENLIPNNQIKTWISLFSNTYKMVICIKFSGYFYSFFFFV